MAAYTSVMTAEDYVLAAVLVDGHERPRSVSQVQGRHWSAPSSSLRPDCHLQKLAYMFSRYQLRNVC